MILSAVLLFIFRISAILRFLAIRFLACVIRLFLVASRFLVRGRLLAIVLFLIARQYLFLVVAYLLVHLIDKVRIVGFALYHNKGIHLVNQFAVGLVCFFLRSAQLPRNLHCAFIRTVLGVSAQLIVGLLQGIYDLAQVKGSHLGRKFVLQIIDEIQQ